VVTKAGLNVLKNGLQTKKYVSKRCLNTIWSNAFIASWHQQSLVASYCSFRGRGILLLSDERVFECWIFPTQKANRPLGKIVPLSSGFLSCFTLH